MKKNFVKLGVSGALALSLFGGAMTNKAEARDYRSDRHYHENYDRYDDRRDYYDRYDRYDNRDYDREYERFKDEREDFYDDYNKHVERCEKYNNRSSCKEAEMMERFDREYFLDRLFPRYPVR